MKRWFLLALAAAALFFGIRAVLRSLASDEQKIRWLVEDAVEGFNDGRVGPVTRALALAPDYRDESGYVREDIRRILAYVYMNRRDPATKSFALRAELLEGGFQLAVTEGTPKTANLELHIQFDELRAGSWESYWPAHIYAELTEDEEGWRFVRTYDVNHRERNR